MIMQDNEKKPALRFKGFTDPWEQRKLGELSRSFEYGLNAAAKEYDGQNKYLRITDIDDTSRQFVSADITSPDANLAEADNYRLSDGDVLFARTGASVGKTYLYKKSDGLVYFAGFLIRAKIKESVSAGFIFQNTLTRSYERYIAITSQRSGQPGVNAQEYAEYQLMLPELFEQEKIAKLLEALDTLITLHQRKYEKLVNIKKSMLDKMFPPNGASVPEIRFKGFTDPWEQRKLDEIANFSKGVGYSKNDLCEEGTPIILYGRLYTKYETSIFDVDTFVKEKAGSVYSKGGEVIVPASGETAEDISIASVVVKPGILLGGDLNIVSPTTEYDSAFLALTISSGAAHEYLSSLAQGKSVVHLHNADIQSVSAKFPTKREQEKIHLLFGKIDTLITLHQREHIKPILEVKRVKRNE